MMSKLRKHNKEMCIWVNLALRILVFLDIIIMTCKLLKVTFPSNYTAIIKLEIYTDT